MSSSGFGFGGRARRVRVLALSTAVLLGASFAAARTDARTPSPARSSGTLDVQPFPGTPDASPQTDIGFPALSPGQIRTLAVTGSRSGSHHGRLIALPDHQGSALIPWRPFAPGEHVSVLATVSSTAAGTASGAPGQTRIAFSFTVAVPSSAVGAVPASADGAPTARLAKGPSFNTRTQRFHSESWLRPPVVSVSGRDPDPGEGDIFADAQDSVEGGPLIFSPQGRLIYFHPLWHTGAFNVEVQQYHGQSVLTYWQGVHISPGHGVILNHSYHRIATVYAGNGYSADAHEFQITPRGEALLTVYAPVNANLSSVGGPRDGALLDSIIQKIDIATGKVLWEWHASGHVPLTDTYAGPQGGSPFDFFHINSIQQLSNGNLLISSRYTWAIYEIDRRTGRIVFELGGKHSSFRMGPGTNFEWQHDAHMQPDGTVTVFDNASDGTTAAEPASRALRIRLNLRTRRATLVSAYTSNPRRLSASQGSVQLLADGNTFIGWGSSPYLTEVGRAGRQLLRLHFPSPVESYRGYRFQWWGQPTTPPSATAVARRDSTTVYASWDGATDVVSWRVLAGPSHSTLSAAGEFPDTSFETAMHVPTTARYLEVQALDGAGNVLGTSATIARRRRRPS